MPRLTACCRISATLLALAASPILPAQTTMPACHPMPGKVETVAPKDLPPPQKLTGIGNLHFPISSKNSETQMWFDQGINLVFDFWDYEANRAFEQAIRTDPNCAICHWALADSLGIHNKEVEGYAHDEVLQAVALRSHANKREKLYIDAAQAEQNGDRKGKKDSDEDPATVILRKLARKYPEDITAHLILSEALQEGYTPEGKARPGTTESMAILQAILKQHPDDSAANHLWVHAVEASPHPEQALHSAEVLGKLVPNSGHMTHMPGHIFYRIGDYQRAQVAFDLSQSVDEAYMQSQHVAADDDWNYVHNLMYSIANLLEQGRLTEAGVVSNRLTAARGSRAATLYPWSTRDSISRLNPMLPIALRSADWPRVESLAAAATVPENLPNLQRLADVLTAFSRGMQALQRNDLDSAGKQSAQLDALLWRTSQLVNEQDAQQAAAEKNKPKDDPKAKPENQPQPTDPNLANMLKNLAILSLELRAAILIPGGKLAEAQALLTQARREETDLGYHEPPAFIRPVAEQEAEFLMAAGAITDAEKAWKKALEDRPNSGYPLYGLAELAEKSGDAAKTATAYQTFLTAWKTADPELTQIKHAQDWLKTHSSQPATGQ